MKEKLQEVATIAVELKALVRANYPEMVDDEDTVPHDIVEMAQRIIDTARGEMEV